MWVAGLRGAMAYALGLQSIDLLGDSGRIILIVTLIYSAFTILGVSTFLYPVIQKCEVSRLLKKDSIENLSI